MVDSGLVLLLRRYFCEFRKHVEVRVRTRRTEEWIRQRYKTSDYDEDVVSRQDWKCTLTRGGDGDGLRWSEVPRNIEGNFDVGLEVHDLAFVFCFTGSAIVNSLTFDREELDDLADAHRRYATACTGEKQAKGRVAWRIGLGDGSGPLRKRGRFGHGRAEGMRELERTTARGRDSMRRDVGGGTSREQSIIRVSRRTGGQGEDGRVAVREARRNLWGKQEGRQLLGTEGTLGGMSRELERSPTAKLSARYSGFRLGPVTEKVLCGFRRVETPARFMSELEGIDIGVGAVQGPRIVVKTLLVLKTGHEMAGSSSAGSGDGLRWDEVPRDVEGNIDVGFKTSGLQHFQRPSQC
ncbi:hypothetical protein IW262DRAFT_1462506 [Armillaria fumosa]|nr:hypothetical protein IW262DRAFT_1462506 [Armillaria fumosa]